MPHQCSDSMLDKQACLSDEVLLQVCRMTVEEAEAVPQRMEDLRAIPRLTNCTEAKTHLELVVTILASVLGQLPRHQPAHLPFGFGGPRVHAYHWIDHETLDGIAKQIVGLVRHDDEPDTIARSVEHATTEAVRLGFLMRKPYDAWRRGMRSGSGWRCAVMATPYGVTKAQILCCALANEDHERQRDSAVSSTVSQPEMTPPPYLPPDLAPDMDQQVDVPAASQRSQVDAAEQVYAWARQADLVKAANQVLGDGMLNKGVLSRACRLGKVETNGRPGQASRVRVTSFLLWLSRQLSLATEEQIQVRNAIIGELTARNV